MKQRKLSSENQKPNQTQKPYNKKTSLMNISKVVNMQPPARKPPTTLKVSPPPANCSKSEEVFLFMKPSFACFQ